MNLQPIPIYEFDTKIFHLFDKQWMLLTGGEYNSGQYNTMTISWGSIGYIWSRPLIHVIVRPQRYTFEFMERYDTFTVCAFPAQYHKALSVLGVKSGRDGNKIAEVGLTPIAASCVQAPAFAEAELIFECRKVYSQDFDPDRFIDPAIDQNYPTRDYHRMYYGEIVAIQGTDKFR